MIKGERRQAFGTIPAIIHFIAVVLGEDNVFANAIMGWFKQAGGSRSKRALEYSLAFINHSRNLSQ
jgi:hypothetical protein